MKNLLEPLVVGTATSTLPEGKLWAKWGVETKVIAFRFLTRRTLEGWVGVLWTTVARPYPWYGSCKRVGLAYWA